MSKIAEGVPGPSSGLPLRTQSEENHMNLGALFKVIDTDKSGTIDLHEFKLACLLSISDEALLEETFAKIDTDGSGEIDLEEFSQGFAVLQEQISYTRKIEDNLRRESLALEQAGEQLEEELHSKEKTEDDLRQEAAALEEAGEQLEDELEDAKEEVQMLAAGLAQVNQKNEEIAQLKEANATLTEELAAAREEIAMLEAGMKAVAERTRPQEEGQASATGAA